MGALVRIARVLLPVAGTLKGNAVRRGFFGGSRGWQLLGAALFVKWFMVRFGGKQPETVAVEQLKRGQTIQISAIDPRPRRRR